VQSASNHPNMRHKSVVATQICRKFDDPPNMRQKAALATQICRKFGGWGA